MSATALVGDADANDRPVEELRTDFRVHVLIFRYMLSSLRDHFGETAKHRTPRLSLAFCRRVGPDDDKVTKFDLLFCDCIHRQDSENGYQWQWQSLTVWIYPELVSRFLELEPTITDTNGAESFFRLQNREDKKLSRQFVLRHLLVQLTSATKFEPPDIFSVPRAHIGTRTLRHFLMLRHVDSNNYPGDVNHQLGISCALTRALSLFYKTSIMPRLWTEDTIEFMFEHRDGSMAICHQFPMISAPADPDPPEDDISALTSRLDAQSLEDPKFPEIKALGVLLLQIWLRMPMAQLSRQYPGFFENGTVTRMGQLNLCHSLHTGILGHLPEELRPVWEVVERCFNDELFEQRTDQEVRIQIHELLFEPLRQLKTAQEAREAEESHEEEGG